ncbi:pyruvate dehydrogenase complex dihydrolipoamide acetyltransferase [Reichenbachiella agarivorans]|uniref:Acetyltransferase component of pyruvate dehydrogenase complex n=1 Tax=Reichenbachiella agarivorans TaxID=2979464 RepID=A0ABY6CUB4_9BACT|nr:pyruvate dehydrogenase complex dihydrolipoamide acetyltransferase [Reichenbachiella agarivorans]UXP33038.1 pyruvate dehydrogenase complex dihydrolipoamide acetyltransferase [Reichenbachiella agarivorans]
MAEVIRMPKMSDTMEEGVIASWLKKVGDTVKSGDILAEVETDKATMELESYEDGTLLYIGIEEKASVPVDGVIAIIGKKGENIDSLISSIGSESKDEAPAKEKTEESAPAAEPAEKIDTSGIKATVIKMPKMSDTMEEGVIAAWVKKVGDTVKSGDILAEVETDKATMELESYDDGVLLYTAVEAGKGVPVDGVIAIIGEKGADYETLLKAEASNKSVTKSAEAAPAAKEDKKETPKAAPAPSAPAASSHSTNNGRVIASPLAKKLAEEKGFDIAQIPGSGDGGRIIKRDVEAFVPTATAVAAGGSVAAAVGVESYEDVPASQMRKAITKSLNASQFGAPHFYLTMEIDMDKTMEARASINEMAAPAKISFNDIVIKAVAAALKKHPMVNSSWISETNSIRMNHHISIGVAMAIEDGLVVPVVKFADNKSLAQISAEVKEFGGKAKAKKLGLDEMQGNTFTVSNLGMFGISEFTSIINAPESCILAVGAIKATPVVKNGQIVPGNIMKVTLTCDHRTVDGAVGSAFLQTLKGFIEDPVRILI